MNSKRKTYLPGSLITCLTCFIIIACDTQEPIAPLPKPPEIKTEQPTIKPLLDLSLENISIEHEMNIDKKQIEKNSALFDTLKKKPHKSEISVSGKLLTDESKDEDYLKSVDGAQINVQGSFD